MLIHARVVSGKIISLLGNAAARVAAPAASDACRPMATANGRSHRRGAFMIAGTRQLLDGNADGARAKQKGLLSCVANGFLDSNDQRTVVDPRRPWRCVELRRRGEFRKDAEISQHRLLSAIQSPSRESAQAGESRWSWVGRGGGRNPRARGWGFLTGGRAAGRAAHVVTLPGGTPQGSWE